MVTRILGLSLESDYTCRNGLIAFRLSGFPFDGFAEFLAKKNGLNNFLGKPGVSFRLKILLPCVFIAMLGGVGPYTIVRMNECESRHDGWIGKPDPIDERHCSYFDMPKVGNEYTIFSTMMGLLYALIVGSCAIRLQAKHNKPRVILFFLFIVPTLFFVSIALEYDLILAGSTALAGSIFFFLKNDLLRAGNEPGQWTVKKPI